MSLPGLRLLAAEVTIWCPVMFRDELDMLEMRLEETSDWAVTVLVEAGVTHRGVPKPLHFAENERRFRRWCEDGELFYECASLPDDPNPWVREHAQRNAAWWIIDSMAEDDDWVIIGDLDEIPFERRNLPSWSTFSLRMRTFLYAVDWEAADQDVLPPTQVWATVHYIREHEGDLAGIRDHRADYPEIKDGGFHFSWLGGPDSQARKL